jgi:arginyl-tRNA synthetase
LKEYLKNKLQEALNVFSSDLAKTIILEKPRQAEHGDVTTNIAMLAAKQLGKKPRQFAQELVNKLHLDTDLQTNIFQSSFRAFLKLKPVTAK